MIDYQSTSNYIETKLLISKLHDIAKNYFLILKCTLKRI